LTKRMDIFYRCVEKMEKSCEGKSDGGLGRYKKIEMLLKDFGNITDDWNSAYLVDYLDSCSRERSGDYWPRNGVNGDAMQGIETTRKPQHTWAAINNGNIASKESEDRPRPPFYTPSYQRSPGQASNVPSLVSTNGDSPILNSPFASTSGNSIFNPISNTCKEPSHAMNSHASLPPSHRHSMAPPTPSFTASTPDLGLLDPVDGLPYDVFRDLNQKFSVRGMDNFAQGGVSAWAPTGDTAYEEGWYHVLMKPPWRKHTHSEAAS